jgi:hypothetical protein
MRIGALIVINDVMVVKGNGEALGTPLCNVQVDNGRLEVGMWYAPRNKVSMLQIIRAYDEGATELTLSGSTDWYACRTVRWQERAPFDAQCRGLGPTALVASLKAAVDSLKGGSILDVDSCYEDGYYSVPISRGVYRRLCLQSGSDAEPHIITAKG